MVVCCRGRGTGLAMLRMGLRGSINRFLLKTSAAMIAIGANDPKWEKEYKKLGSVSGAYDDWHEGNDPAGISTQDKKLMKRLNPIKAGKKLSNYLKVMTLEAQTIARACGKNNLHNLEPEDLCALTVESAAMARVPLAGTNWIPGFDK